MGSISQQNPVKLFIAHGFERSDDYLRVFEYLESAHNFYYLNCSSPDYNGNADQESMRTELRRQINLAEVAIIPAGLYVPFRDWVEFELNCAKGFDKPVIVLESFGAKEKIPVQLEALADEIIEWNDRSIADAIRRQARHEETVRWDTIEFKLD
ncbi:MAG: molecular chaperone Tir [Candidatus Obscuribacterales bacterium]|nr:molecular chaperone Tir [Steroidobacteraceae bacterium]